MSSNTSLYARYPSLEGRVVLITGGASGIGESFVTHFARQGARVAFFDILDEPAHALARSLIAEGCPTPSYLNCDLADVAALRIAIERILGAYGTVDVLINNAANDQRHQTEDVTPEYWDNCIAVNLRPHFFAIQAVAPAMRAAGRGSIINMSSISWTVPSTGLPAYTTAKAGVVGLTRTMAHELGPANIRVNAILPGAIATERQERLWYTPEYKANFLNRQAMKHILYPDDVARLALFLAADDSSGITNQSYVIDAGYT
jgi:NAD(P)-dependent dehydrogenase (short-subunit alcohol dehydrogenase family)